MLGCTKAKGKQDKDYRERKLFPKANKKVIY